MRHGVFTERHCSYVPSSHAAYKRGVVERGEQARGVRGAWT